MTNTYIIWIQIKYKGFDSCNILKNTPIKVMSCFKECSWHNLYSKHRTVTLFLCDTKIQHQRGVFGKHKNLDFLHLCVFYDETFDLYLTNLPGNIFECFRLYIKSITLENYSDECIQRVSRLHSIALIPNQKFIWIRVIWISNFINLEIFN